MKTNRWEIWGYSGMLKKFTALAYCKTRREAVALLSKWRTSSLLAGPAMVQKRSK